MTVDCLQLVVLPLKFIISIVKRLIPIVLFQVQTQEQLGAF